MDNKGMAIAGIITPKLHCALTSGKWTKEKKNSIANGQPALQTTWREDIFH